MAVLSSDASVGLDAALRAAEDWIDAGNPTRALEELDLYRGPAPATEILRVRIRARFALGDYAAVIGAARQQHVEAAPNAVLLAYGAHAAQLNGDIGIADAWLAQATALAAGPSRAQVVGTYLRVHALRNDTPIEDLEAYVSANIPLPETVALALADAAFQLGALERALHWYGIARQRQAHWHPGAAGNALGAEIWQQIKSIQRGVSDRIRLSECAQELSRLLDDPRIAHAGLTTPMWFNLGHARRTLGDSMGAAAAWDRALSSLATDDDDLWVRRCILSANDGVPLPADDLAARWTSPRARVVLASACTLQGDWDRAERLLSGVDNDPLASCEDRTLARIERIRLEVRGDDAKVTATHVGSMVSLANTSSGDVPLFAWLVDHIAAAGAEWTEAVREILFAMAGTVDLDPMRRMALAEAMLSAGLDDIAHGWTSAIEAFALDDTGDVTHPYGASLLLRLYTGAFRFQDARRVIAGLQPFIGTNVVVALACGRALEEAGDRQGAYHLLTRAIAEGQRHGSVILSWARIAVVTKRQRDAKRLLHGLTLSPRDAADYAQVFQARALLNVQTSGDLDGGDIPIVSAATAGAIFGAGIHHRARRPGRVAYGRVVHVRITENQALRFDEPVLFARTGGKALDGVQVLTAEVCPWIAELLDANVGESRPLTSVPFTGALATIVDVIDADRWSFLQALKMVQVLPPATTGVRSVPADQAQLQREVEQHDTAIRRHQQSVLTTATDGQASIAMTAAVLSISPRALLRKRDHWRPIGHPGTNEEITAEDREIATCERLVLDPVALLLLVELHAERVLAVLPAKAIMTPQAVQQLVDWWYGLERIRRGLRAQAILTSRGLAILPITAKRRRDILNFWRRVRDTIMSHVEVVEPSPISDPQFVRTRELLGGAVVSGMALAHQRGWSYLTEEFFMRKVNRGVVGGKTISVHRLLIVGSQRGRWRETSAIRWTAQLIERGWRWVSFPTSWLARALYMPAGTRQVVLPQLLNRVRQADPKIAIEAILGLLRENELGRFRDAGGRRLRQQLIAALPPQLPADGRAQVVEAFARILPGKAHRQCLLALKAWAQQQPTEATAAQQSDVTAE